MQHPTIGRIGLIAQCVIAQIVHYIELMRLRIARHLIDGGAGQCHQWHLGRLEIDFLGVPFGGYGKWEVEGRGC